MDESYAFTQKELLLAKNLKRKACRRISKDSKKIEQCKVESENLANQISNLEGRLATLNQTLKAEKESEEEFKAQLENISLKLNYARARQPRVTQLCHQTKLEHAYPEKKPLTNVGEILNLLEEKECAAKSILGEVSILKEPQPEKVSVLEKQLKLGSIALGNKKAKIEKIETEIDNTKKKIVQIQNERDFVGSKLKLRSVLLESVQNEKARIIKWQTHLRELLATLALAENIMNETLRGEALNNARISMESRIRLN